MVVAIIAALALIVLVAVILIGVALGGFDSAKLSASLVKLFSVSIELKGPQRRPREAGEHRNNHRSIPPA